MVIESLYTLILGILFCMMTIPLLNFVTLFLDGLGGASGRFTVSTSQAAFSFTGNGTPKVWFPYSQKGQAEKPGEIAAEQTNFLSEC